MADPLGPLIDMSSSGMLPDPMMDSDPLAGQQMPIVPSEEPQGEEDETPSPPPLSLTPRIDSDDDFKKRILQLVKDYRNAARNALDFYSGDFDAAHDLIMCYSMLTKADMTAMSKGHMRKFILPMTATHIQSMTTYIASALFGGEQVHKVDAGGPEDEAATRVMNSLLSWNASQQKAGIYQLGWFWVENSLTYNRGVMYEEYAPIFKSKWTVDEKGKSVKQRQQVGSYNKLSIISPYDFYIDPLIPLYLLQEGRFAGHRVPKPWNDLKNRSDMDEDDPQYVSKKAVNQLKKDAGKGNTGNSADAGVLPNYAGSPGIVGSDKDKDTSRTAYERSQMAAPMTLNSSTGAKDPGVVDFVEMWVKIVPKDYDIDSRTEPTIYQITMGNDKEILSMIESTYEHEQFPYSIGEARPSPFYQYSPSWALMLKNLQDYVDYLKNRHQDAVMRTIGNIFIAKQNLVDITDFEDPDKEGKFIMLKPEAVGMEINDVIRQVPMVDITQNFMQEMKGFVQYAESVTSASSGIQGQTSSGTTATEFSGSMQMATGRLSAIARLLSVQGLVPQTQRFVSNFQQFYDGEMVRKIEGEGLIDLTDEGPKIVQITSDTIQGSFDYRAHDGTMPGADTKKVAALTRSLEAMKLYPQIFTPGPGNLNPSAIFRDLLKISGMNVAQYRYTDKQIQQAQMQQQQAMQMQQQQAQAAQSEADQREVAMAGATSAAKTEGRIAAESMRPGPAPRNDIPDAGTPMIKGAGPKQARPSNA